MDELSAQAERLATAMEQGDFHRLEAAMIIRRLVKRNGELEGQVRTAAEEINEAHRISLQARERLARVERDFAGWPQSRLDLMLAVMTVLGRAYRVRGRAPWNRQEFYARLLKQVDLLWNAVKEDLEQEELLAQLVQVVATCFRYAETDDRDRGFHSWPTIQGENEGGSHA